MNIHETKDCADGKQVWIRVDKADMPMVKAAPGLLDTCTWLLFHAENGRRWKTIAHRGLDFADDEFEGKLRAAIAKAEGRE